MRSDSEPSAYPDTPFTVGYWLVDPSANELHRDATTVRLEPKAMRVLCVLAERPGSVVAREDLESRVWAGMVVTSDAVTNTIIKLRKVFGDDSRYPSYIETISKTGYRLVAEVGPGPTAKPAPRNRETWKVRRPVKWLVPLMVALLLGFWLVSQEYGVKDVKPQQSPRVAVLPFENLSTDPKQDYFADGITEDLITDLSKVSGLELLELFRGNYDAAIRNAEYAISIKPSYADAFALRAWIQHFDGRVADGLASMEQAVRLNPRIPSVYRLLRGVLYYAQGDLDRALADLEAALEVNPNYQNLRIWLAAAYAAADRIDEANWQSGEILALHPDFSLSQALWAFPIRDPAYHERFLGDLRRAGLPD